MFSSSAEFNNFSKVLDVVEPKNRMSQEFLSKDVALSVCSDLCTQTIMLIDDAPFNLIPLEGMLESKSIFSAKFNNGKDAVRCF